jgi:hypothetical protein
VPGEALTDNGQPDLPGQWHRAASAAKFPASAVKWAALARPTQMCHQPRRQGCVISVDQREDFIALYRIEGKRLDSFLEIVSRRLPLHSQ